MRANFEYSLQADNRLDNSDRNCLLVAGSTAGAAEHFRGSVIRDIDDDRFEALAGQLAQCRVGVATEFDRDIEIAQHAAQHSHNLFVRAQH